MAPQKMDKKIFLSDIAILIYLALITVIGHLLISGNYGYFLDELYTIACSKHLSFGFIDLPPVAPALLALNTAILGNSLSALHFLPSLVSGFIVIIIGLMARQLGGGRFAVVLAGLAAVFAPVWMALGSLYTYDFLDQFFIILLFFAVLRLIKTENSASTSTLAAKTWLIIGAIAGIGLMTKPSMVFFIAALTLGLLLTKHRKHLLTPWPWLGAGIALLIILPSLIWQGQHGFPIAEYWQAYSKNKAVNANPVQYLLMQIIVMNPFLFPIWLMGLYYFLFHREGKKYRLLGLIFVILLCLLMYIRANVQMLPPAYAMLMAGGAVGLERFFQKMKRRTLMRSIQFGYIFLIILFGLIQAPNFMPILPVENLVKYYQIVGGITGVTSVRFGHDQFIELPNYFYNRFEWDVLVKDIAGVYYGLPEKERKDTAIVTQNYGWAGAVDLLGEKMGLPKATCGQLNYYLFGIDNIGKGTWIIIGESADRLVQLFKEVSLAKIVLTKYRLPHETYLYICKGPIFSLQEARVGIKKFE